MIEKNFWTPNPHSLTTEPNSHVDLSNENLNSILYKEKLLLERLDRKNYYNGWNSFLQYFSESNRRAVLWRQTAGKPVRDIAVMLGFDAVVGQEKLFNFPSWWSFRQVERAALLARTLQQSRSVGLITNFDELYSSQVRVFYVATAKEEISEQGNLDGGVATVTIKDSLTQESLVLLLYGILLATVVFLAEAICISGRHA